GGVAPAPRRGDVVGDLGPAPEPAGPQRAYGDAGLDHEIKVGGLEHEAAARYFSEGHEKQPGFAPDDPGAARVGGGDLLEVALAREHGHARGVHQFGAAFVAYVAHALRWVLDLTLQIGTRRGARVGLPAQRQARD